ncbi:5-hydroxytryptamine receptor 1-like [Stylophora pistillata]|uniref:5-hydroxytryptamine receptor 1-like n=1 Tax=Stylophora pistillata TaxID=50429 RepID=UPI000C04ADA3|nr:5-hydroxytryptamine receptor 1-like [Stylophora pistillata]XP_022792450.1 5-hydroxytryptamine receptor 1-like [Stylophora pistillata]XP_022792451.1 5-hydroxytryptamine receptor 1-like [Stylophora pistillata]XP_022792452.1 5-hydroxytryptamine receptor 1-like [Stylophora pistillata]XP_022792454.1 5-hydroxytryptamine receptor 1-like [Stylophora pistillata]XP_022792455.1 5-hydroxytryptamine receptor 1-like [Stylophora pistillata]
METQGSLATRNCSNCSTSDPVTGHEFEENMSGFDAQNDVVPIAIAIPIIAVNCWVISLVCLKRSLRTVTNYILTSLALSDLWTGMISIPLFLCCNIIQETEICTAAMLFMRFTSTSTVLHILAMTTDRYICIVYALRYMTWVTKRRVLHVIAAIWAISLFVMLVQLEWYDMNEGVNEEFSPENKKKIIIVDSICFFAFVGLPVMVMAYTYGRILYEVHRQSRNIQRHNTPGWQETKKSTRQEWKVASVFMVMLLVFIVCWGPFYLLRLERVLSSDFFRVTFSVFAQILMLWLRFVSSLINPCLYILGKPDFRKASGLSMKKRRFNDSEATRLTQSKGSTSV